MSAFRRDGGVRWGYVASNPAAAVGPNPQPTTIEVPFTLAEVDDRRRLSPTGRWSCSRPRRRFGRKSGPRSSVET
jgi:hypothetical protein